MPPIQRAAEHSCQQGDKHTATTHCPGCCRIIVIETMERASSAALRRLLHGRGWHYVREWRAWACRECG